MFKPCDSKKMWITTCDTEKIAEMVRLQPIKIFVFKTNKDPRPRPTPIHISCPLNHIFVMKMYTI